MNWKWVNRQALVTLHHMSLAEHGGASGIRARGLLESALAWPENLAAYGEPDYASLAASYGVGLAKNQAFVDGNKRVVFLSVGLFLVKKWLQTQRYTDRVDTGDARRCVGRP